MASPVSLFLAIVIGAHAAESKSFVEVECKTANVGQYGQQSMLECMVTTTSDVTEPTIRAVIWKKKGSRSNLVFFSANGLQMQEGYRFAVPLWNERNMNISLLIANTEVGNEGDYECTVQTDSGGAKSVTQLSVRANYSKPRIHSIPEKITRDKDVTLYCTSGHGYPEGRLLWFDVDEKEWTGSSKMEAKKLDNGLFQLTSKLHLARNSIYSEYTCAVYNADQKEKEDEATFIIPSFQAGDKGLDPASKIVAPVVVIGSIIVGLLTALLVYRRRSQQARRLSATPLMNAHRQVPDSNFEDVSDLESMERNELA